MDKIYLASQERKTDDGRVRESALFLATKLLMKVRNIVYWYNGKQFVTGNLLTTAMDICHVNVVILGGHTKKNVQFGN